MRGKKKNEAFLMMCDARSSFSNVITMQDAKERSKKCEHNTTLETENNSLAQKKVHGETKKESFFVFLLFCCHFFSRSLALLLELSNKRL